MTLYELRKKVEVECGALHSHDSLVDVCHKIMSKRIKELEGVKKQDDEEGRNVHDTMCKMQDSITDLENALGDAQGQLEERD